MMGDTYRVQTKMHTDDILAQIDAQLAGRPYSDLFTREAVYISWRQCTSPESSTTPESIQYAIRCMAVHT